MVAAKDGRGRSPDPALSTWRHADPGRIGPVALAQVRRAVAGAPLLHHRRWPAALRGDTAAAIAVALRRLPTPGGDPLATDIAMSRLLLDAAEGDAAAALVLDHAVRRLGPKATKDDRRIESQRCNRKNPA